MQAQNTTGAGRASIVPPLEAMTDVEVLAHLREMHSYRMPCCVTSEDHDRDHERTDRNVALDIEPHTHQATKPAGGAGRVLLATVALAAVVALAAGCSQRPSSAPAPTSTTYSIDCRLGPSDCGYADNGHNSDH